jgi:protein TonB
VLTRADLGATAVALAAHALVGWAILRAPPPAARRRPVIEVELHAPRAAPSPAPPIAPPPIAPPAPPPPPPHHLPVRLALAPPAPPSPAGAPPSAEPVRPVFGVTMDSTTAGDAAVAVPIGNTTALDPAASAPHRGSVRPLPPGDGTGPGTGGALSIATLPDVDTEACGRTVSYPAEAERAGIEGAVKLRVALDERGQVVEVKVLEGLGHGLDEAAVEALRHRCRFTPAITSGGHPVPFVIDPYVFHFEIPR